MRNKETPYLGIIGGSGIYDLDNISEAKMAKVYHQHLEIHLMKF